MLDVGARATLKFDGIQPVHFAASTTDASEASAFAGHSAGFSICLHPGETRR
jgi:hypothetical protein